MFLYDLNTASVVLPDSVKPSKSSIFSSQSLSLLSCGRVRALASQVSAINHDPSYSASVAVLGFFVWGANGGGYFCLGGLMRIKRRRRETTIAEGNKPLTTRGDGGAS